MFFIDSLIFFIYRLCLIYTKNKLKFIKNLVKIARIKRYAIYFSNNTGKKEEWHIRCLNSI